MSINCKILITRELFHRDDYYILSARPVDSCRQITLNQWGGFSLVGNLGYLTVDSVYEVVLEEAGSSKYGMNYKVVSCPTIERQKLDELSYDDKFKIMKQATSSDRLATNVLKAYPNFIADVVMHSDEELDNGIIDIKNIFGVGSKYYKVFKRILREKYLYFGFTNREELKKYELTVEDAKAIFKRYPHADDGSVALEKHPYRVLIGLCGHSFDKVDKLLKSARSDLIDSDERCEAVVLDILHKNESEGNSRLNGSKLYMVMRDDYNCPELHKRLLNVCKSSEELYYDEPTKDISIMSTYMKEVNIASYVKSANENCEELDFNVEDYRVLDNGIELTDEQLKAVENFKKYRFSILAGKSGSGKSSSARAIANVCKDLHLTITQLAPTATAAKRLTETTGISSSTIHLKCLRDGEICTDVLLVDESSMVGLDVFSMMMDCITNDKIRIVLVGDNFQLASISYGTVFSDLIVSNKVPKIVLSKVFRYNDSGIAYAGENARQGRNFFNDEEVKHSNGVYSIMNNWFFIEKDSDEAIADEVVSQYKKILSKGVKEEDLLVLSAFNVGSCGSLLLNSKLQETLNPPTNGCKMFERKVNNFGKIVFRIGDRVINKKNMYKCLTYDGWLEMEQSNGLFSEDEVETVPIFNGQRGVVVDINDKVMVVKFEENLVVYDKLTVYNLLLGYAISTFSAQGQESPYVINVVTPTQTRLMSKNLLYVADTRAKKEHIDIGSVKAYTDALLVDNVAERNTWLVDLLTM